MTHTWYQGLLSKLPSYDPTWPPDVAAAWYECFTAMLHIAEKLDAEDAQ